MKKFEQCLPSDIIRKKAVIGAYTTFDIGGRCSAVLLPRTKKELIDCVRACKSLNYKFQVLGNASNILAPSQPTRRVYVLTSKMENQISLHQTTVKVSAGVLLGELILWCKEQGLSGLENLFGIPATVGGAVMVNAGAFGQEIFDCLEAVEIYHKGKIKILTKDQIEKGHHQTSLQKTSAIILSAEFKFLRLASSVIQSQIKNIVNLRAEKQPKGRSAGCIFRAVNGLPAGKIIDELGLKNLRVGNAVISEKHANFIINEGGATDKDVKLLIKEIQDRVKQKYGFILEREIEFIGERDDYYR